MPISVKDYRWSETKEQIFISVPLKGVRASNVDIMCTPEFIKASYPPFLFEVLLNAPIVDAKSAAKIRDGCVIFTLIKEIPEIWTQLLSPNAADTQFHFKKKQEAIAYDEKRTRTAVIEKSEVKEQNKKFALKKMMQLEEQERSKIESEKENERIQAANELNKWKEKKKQEAEEEKIRLVQEEEEKKRIEESRAREGTFTDNIEPQMENKITQLFGDDKVLYDTSDKKELEEHKVASVAVPPQKKVLIKPALGPRKSGKISITFTPRVFPTPQRESKVQEEDEWLQKQADARKRMDIDNKDLAEHEKDPDWLKDKGAQLFAAEDFLAAVNAYNLAIKIQSKDPILFLNRSACHLKLRNLFKTSEDCSTALNLMQPAVDGNSKGRLKAHLRRAAAFCGLELYVEALMDYEAALKINPHNENILKDANKIREIIQSS
uniref:Dynein axonemal assembly factor 4 n=1 Tax=Ciona intestinalis TaxID=7719 RepID=Q5VJS0_CIOIN|nr:EKN1 protein [Ciona intestinalis]AAR89529.1 EKN1 [Ciona intestinalis]|eukprot:NP_001027805.1 EKN1 protein [Ciona intestinalis]